MIALYFDQGISFQHLPAMFDLRRGLMKVGRTDGDRIAAAFIEPLAGTKPGRLDTLLHVIATMIVYRNVTSN